MATHFRLELVDAQEAVEGAQVVTGNGIVHLSAGQRVISSPGKPVRIVDRDVFENEYREFSGFPISDPDKPADTSSANKRPAVKR